MNTILAQVATDADLGLRSSNQEFGLWMLILLSGLALMLGAIVFVIVADSIRDMRK